MIEDLWYKNAVIYSLDLETFMDANGDGCGDFEGLTRRLDYLHSLGIEHDLAGALPAHAQPRQRLRHLRLLRRGSAPRHAVGDFVEFMHQANKRGIRVIIDLVVNHTSDEHPWFQAARARPELEVPRLVRLVEEAPEGVEQGDGLSRRAEGDVDEATRRRASTTTTASTTSSRT